mmetsp:Transcript_44387/g.93213  ORF Transcript_44387/g.93213 Transcript_44387/m.93213 type:complete len:792 (-) Transcript_44387:232-2607(-)
MATNTKDLVLAYLRSEKIRLWLPPYYHSHGVDGNHPGANDEALSKLAESLTKKLNNTNGTSQAPCGSAGTMTLTTDGISSVLIELQSYAVQKLREKHSINVKILASKRHFAALFTDGDGDDSGAGASAGAAADAGAATTFANARWGDEVTITSTTHNRDNNGNNSLLLRVVNISPALTVEKFSSDICRAMDARTARVIWKGKNLLSSSASATSLGGGGGQQTTLRKIVSANASNNTTDQKKKNELLCLVSGFGHVDTAALAIASAALSSSNIAGTALAGDRTDSSIIDSIRQAAHTIQSSAGGSRFEVTDQSGNLVPMSQSDTVGFLTALGLHRIGRSKMDNRNSIVGMTDSTSNEDGNSSRDVSSALVFLLEADAEWNNSAALESWKSKVDNYGLLQLDIAWCYLLLESLDGLDDAVRRLGIAEQVLRKQVHTNFVTLAVAQAEMNHAIPCICAVFVRLFLLQGVANKIQNCNATATERLGWARLLCHRLRSSSPMDSVETLCNAYIVDPFTAIAALRRSNGDPDAAGNFIAADRTEQKQAAKKRRRQHKFGKCENGNDFVDLDLVPCLSNLLGYNDVAINLDDPNESDDHRDFGDDASTSTMIVIGLLRLSNNNINHALDIFNSATGAQEVLEQIARLDEASGRRKRKSNRGNERQQPIEYEVKDVDLAMLASMGVEEARCRAALKATGNVESAILWLSEDDSKANEAITVSNDCPQGNTGDSVAHDQDEDDGDDDSISESGKTEIDDAYEILERELGNALGADSKQLLEKEWLGVDLQDEWDLIEKYI